MLRRLDFYEKCCFGSCSVSISVNGSPTMEFGMQRGIKQGDPLAHFVVEHLSGFMLEVIGKRLSSVYRVGDGRVEIELL